MVLVVLLLVLLSGPILGFRWVLELQSNPALESRRAYVLGCFVVYFTTFVNMTTILIFPLTGLYLLPRGPLVLVCGWICVAVCFSRACVGSATFGALLFPSLFTLMIGAFLDNA